MVAKGSPKVNMIARASPKLHKFLANPSGIKKKASPKCSKAKKAGGSPRVKQRAEWNPALEKSLVDILHEYKDSGYRGDNGWSSEGWNKMVKEFHLRNKYVNYTKSQIQDKEVQLKRDYRMLKEARQQSGATWNEDRNVIEGTPALWANLEVTFPKIKKFRNSKARFPLFDALGELYDGHLAEGTYNINSLEPPQEEAPLRQIHDVDDLDNNEVHELLDDDDLVTEMQTSEAADERNDGEKNEIIDVERSGQRRTTTTTSSKKHEKQMKRPKNKGERIEEMMGRYLDMRTKQVQDESAELAKEKEDLAKEKEVAQDNDFSIKRCISVLSTMEVTKEEKAKAFAVFIKSKENREAFLSGCELDQEATLVWLKSAMV
ncbi:uncharacterized protein LOC8085172 [Sorghum bicolor]|uniref:uncharacterized protein LOC8085172 n=1 Tax=Sorghum bicolor TaxID=4558 RepID=UPI000B4267D6|nr:uncharacterized protein LOC8085172 [Sorghum bicolor]|eukprot:XP_002453129.2 uncharacterized protein LOC8085172 [Sorghum bicolor]